MNKVSELLLKMKLYSSNSNEITRGTCSIFKETRERAQTQTITGGKMKIKGGGGDGEWNRRKATMKNSEKKASKREIEISMERGKVN